MVNHIKHFVRKRETEADKFNKKFNGKKFILGLRFCFLGLPRFPIFRNRPKESRFTITHSLFFLASESDPILNIFVLQTGQLP